MAAQCLDMIDAMRKGTPPARRNASIADDLKEAGSVPIRFHLLGSQALATPSHPKP